MGEDVYWRFDISGIRKADEKRSGGFVEIGSGGGWRLR
jgi:hypothetical protein